jgi:uncharacterized membrane protein
MAWTAIFLATVLLLLMLFVIDGSRLLYVRGRLQTATDAACEDAAWAAGDRPNYMDTGQTRLGNNWVRVLPGWKELLPEYGNMVGIYLPGLQYMTTIR